MIDDVLEVHRFHDISLELRVHEGLFDLLEEQHADSAGELGRDRLGLERDSKLLLVGLDVGSVAGEQTDERGLSGTVLSQHDDDLGVSEATGLDSELKAAEGLGHGRIRVMASLVDEQLLSGLHHLE